MEYEMNMQEEIILLREAVARIETKLDNFPVCPMPGECLKLEPRIRVLEDSENQRKGGWIALTFIATAVATMFTWVISIIKSKRE